MKRPRKAESGPCLPDSRLSFGSSGLGHRFPKLSFSQCLSTHVVRAAKCTGWMWPVQVGNVKLHARLTATHAPNGRAASGLARCIQGSDGITSVSQKAAVVVSITEIQALMGYVTATLARSTQVPIADAVTIMETCTSSGRQLSGNLTWAVAGA